MSNERKRKPRPNVKPYSRTKSGLKAKTDAPKTSAKARPKYARENLILSDWLEVVDYHDTNQPISQQDVVEYFSKRQDGALIFRQSTLSRHLSKKGREADKNKLASNPTALSAKRVQIVTRPDVEGPLGLW